MKKNYLTLIVASLIITASLQATDMDARKKTMGDSRVREVTTQELSFLFAPYRPNKVVTRLKRETLTTEEEALFDLIDRSHRSHSCQLVIAKDTETHTRDLYFVSKEEGVANIHIVGFSGWVISTASVNLHTDRYRLAYLSDYALFEKLNEALREIYKRVKNTSQAPDGSYEGIPIFIGDETYHAFIEDRNRKPDRENLFCVFSKPGVGRVSFEANLLIHVLLTDWVLRGDSVDSLFTRSPKKSCIIS